MSENDTQSLTEHLENIKDQYQQQSLISRLEALAADLRELLLEQAVSETLLDYNAETHEELRDVVTRLKSAAADGDLATIEQYIGEAENALNTAENRMQAARATPQTTYVERLDSMMRLNEQLGVVDDTTLHELRKIVSEGQWTAQIEIEENASIDEAVSTAREYGERRREEYEAAEQAIFEPYFEGEFEGIVRDLLSDTPLVLSDVDIDTLDKFADSDLGDHVSLRFT